MAEGRSEIQVINNLACGDACCCFTPPDEVLDRVDSGCNLVLELRGENFPYEPLYEFNEGKCPNLDFRIGVSEIAGRMQVQVLGRCGVWEDPDRLPGICREYPRNTSQVFCDYEKNLWSEAEQTEQLGCTFTLYYGFQKSDNRGYGLERFCRDQQTVDYLMRAKDDFKEVRIKEISWEWLLVQVPVCPSVCAHLPRVGTHEFLEVIYGT